jgi:hypothetical protein
MPVTIEQEKAPRNQGWVYQIQYSSEDLTGQSGFQDDDKSQLAMAESPSFGSHYSPNALLKTGPRMCLPEKSQHSDFLRCRALRSVLRAHGLSLGSYCAPRDARGKPLFSDLDFPAQIAETQL